MKTRDIGLVAGFLALVFLGQAAGRFVQIGGAQLAPSIVVFVLLALVMAPTLPWGPLVGLALAVSALTALATSSPFPLASLSHGIAFLLCAAAAKRLGAGGRPIGAPALLLITGAVPIIDWTIFAALTWLGLRDTSFVAREFGDYGLTFGRGFGAWWIFGFVSVVVPTALVALVLVPILYRAIRSALSRSGVGAVPARS